MAPLEGVLTAMATPFEEGGAVDEAAARRLAVDVIEHGSHGIVVAGSTGEAATLDDAEHIALLRTIVDEVGDRATIVCGTGTNDTRHSIELTKAAADAGAEAALIVTPYYNKPNPAGILAHFEAIAAAVPELPLIAYNIPSRVVVNVPPADLARAGRDRQRRRPQAGQRRRAAADRRPRGAGRQRRRLPANARDRRGGGDPRRLPAGRAADAGDLGRRPVRRPRPRA